MKNNSTSLTKRIEALIYLGKQIELKDEQLLGIQEFSKHKNSWFTLDNTNLALENIASRFLQKEKLKAFVQQYELPEFTNPKIVGIIMKGNIPMVGFHDLLCVFLSGHFAKIKLSEDDKHLIPHLIKIMMEGFPELKDYFEFIERMPKFDAIIASGNRDSLKTYETYFSKFPNIIRKNNHSIAILDGTESKEDLSNLGKDIFNYFGLSSRSVSKIYLPPDFDFIPLLEATHEFNHIVINNNKYKNNFDYNYTLHIVNSVDYKANGCIMIIEDEALQSRIATLHYEVYEDEEHLQNLLLDKQKEIHQIISNKTFANFKNKDFGAANRIELNDFENGIDVMNLLTFNA